MILPFVCVTCEVGWVDTEKPSCCEFCGNPGFTNYRTPRHYAGIDAFTFDMLLTAARID